MRFLEIILDLKDNPRPCNIKHSKKGYVAHFDDIDKSFRFSFTGLSKNERGPSNGFYPYFAEIVCAIVRGEDGKVFDSPNCKPIGRTGDIVIPIDDFLDDCWELAEEIEKYGTST